MKLTTVRLRQKVTFSFERLWQLVEKEINGCNAAIAGDDEISPGIGWRLTWAAQYPSDPPAITHLLGLGNHLIPEISLLRTLPQWQTCLHASARVGRDYRKTASQLLDPFCHSEKTNPECSVNTTFCCTYNPRSIIPNRDHEFVGICCQTDVSFLASRMAMDISEAFLNNAKNS